MTIKKLNKRQIKWVEFLVKFDFKIIYQSKKKNDKADSLIKRFENRSKNESNDRNKHMHQIVLSSNKVDSQIMQELNDTKEIELSLFDKVKSANQENSTCITIRDAIRNRKKFFDEMFLKSLNQSRIFSFSKRNCEYLNLISWNWILYEKFMINLSQNIQTYVVHANIWINDIIDRKSSNQ
jgi:hypothetical protein